MIGRERRYTAKHREWKQYQDWKKNRNPKRAEMEAKFGFDGKHGLHLRRLGEAAEQILLTGKVVVRHPNPERLLDIRYGKVPYEELAEWFDAQMIRVKDALGKSVLPKDPDYNALNKLHQKLVEESFA